MNPRSASPRSTEGAGRGAWDRTWINVHAATMTDPSLGIVEDAAVSCANGRVAWVGPRADLPPRGRGPTVEVVDGGGAWLTPGFVDCHTHLVHGGGMAGGRGADFRRRVGGESYAEIARAGGGVMATVRATRDASFEELVAGAVARGRELAAWGVTTIEVKSGYGLDAEHELGMLEAASALPGRLPVEVSPTLLAGHAVPPQYALRRADYVAFVVDELVPAALRQGIATAIDAFCEGIAFSPAECRAILQAGIDGGLAARVHADQLSDLGGGALAARVGARSADHLEHLSRAGVRAMAKRGVRAVLLPGAAYTLGLDRRPPVRALRRAGVPMAVATDANPGSAPITHVGMILNAACVLFGLTPEEALLGVTSVAAEVLGVRADRGAVEVGKRADLALWDVADPAELCRRIGASPLRSLVKDGVPVEVAGAR